MFHSFDDNVSDDFFTWDGNAAPSAEDWSSAVDTGNFESGGDWNDLLGQSKVTPLKKPSRTTR
ncbi:MAG: hypothetical protein HQM12_17990 [SAR324 cluster bacterium]|nr:hypothetical protein [SAR324 cluster bacterium]